ncbi:hypothetical protein [Faecalicoccus sp.]|uniref:hypothetical protein n=1 Tax=Faecalicoccus sp. TaxID=1971758 RepID=UPI002A80B0EC|nr:hypothetical protein [Faecalicoccus sp.]MDY5109728.1 hypothetical protein [Faecalicoccus sp.]
MKPTICNSRRKVKIPIEGNECEFWLITVTDEQSITNPDKDHAYLTDSGKLYIYNGNTLIQVNCDICFTQEERDKLEGIEEGANKYVLPVATDNALGGIKTGFTQTEKQYAVEVTEEGQAYVTVPWTDTVYTLPVAETNTLGGIKTGYEKQGQNYPVLVDVDGNAYVNVPWTNTDTKYNVVSTTENGLAPMLPTENADNKFLNGDGEWVEVNESINGNTVTGSTFSGETSDCGVQILEVKGKTVQQTTNGYQLFDASKISSLNGITATKNDDGSITLNGTATDDADFFKIGAWNQSEIVLSGTTKWKADVSNSNILIIGVNGTNQVKSTELSTAENSYTGELTYFLMRVPQGRTLNNFTFKFMLYQDGDGTWEPYTGGKPAPNPDYPMPIENVEVSKIISHGRQLFDSSKLDTKSQGGATVTNNGDGSFTISGSGNLTENFANMQYSINSYDFKKLFKVGNVYLKGAINKGIYFEVVYIKSDGNLYQRNNKTINLTNEIYNAITSVSIIFYGNTGNAIPNETIKPMLYQEGDGTWEPYQGATVETSLTLAEGDTYENGQVTRARKQVVFDGSSDEAWTRNSTNEKTYRFMTLLSDSLGGSLWLSKSGQACNRLPVGNTFSEIKGDCFSIDNSKNLTVYIDELKNSTLEEFKTWLSTHPLTFEYELETPTTEEFKVPTIPSYEPYTEISTNSVVDPEITFRPLPFTTCLVGEATEEESGYMPPLSGNSNEFLNGNGEWSVPSGYTLPTASSTVLGGVKIGSNITVSSGTISLTKSNVVDALGYTPPTTNTTYEVATTSDDGLMSATDKSRLDQLWAKFDSMVFFTED